jgi:hypothetical protein
MNDFDYPGSPLIFDAKSSIESGKIQVSNRQVLIFKISGSEVRVPPNQQYSLVSPTMLGLNSALVRAESGNSLRSIYETELEKYNQATEKGKEMEYGEWVYYPRRQIAVQFSPRRIHRLAAIASNAQLILDPEMKQSFAQVDKMFQNTTVGLVGLSVGSNIGLSVLMGMRMENMVVSDMRHYKMTNINRVMGLRAEDLVEPRSNKSKSDLNENPLGLRNKTHVFASQVHAIDPFCNIFCFDQGVDESNIKDFYRGHKGKPAVNFSIEVCDSLDTKLSTAFEARRRGVRHLRFTDAGTVIWVDNRPFDQDRNAPISFGVKDNELKKLASKARSSETGFFDFASALVGEEHLTRKDEFSHLIKTHQLSRIFSSIPQFGPTVIAAGGWAGILASRIRLGYKFPERMMIDLGRFEMKSWGEWV